MLRFEGTSKVLKDRWDSASGWLPLSCRGSDLYRLIGQDVLTVILIDEDTAHDPKSLGKLEVKKESPGIYKVNEHNVTFKPRYTCDCDYYQYSKGDKPCKHLIAIMKQMIADKRF